MVCLNSLMALILAILLLLLPTVINAGHPSWEPRPSAFKLNYVHLLPREGYEPWPNKKIRYCYESSRAQSVLAQLIQHAMNLWWGAGLPHDYVMEEIPRSECLADRKNSLEIRLSDMGYFSTSTGKSTPRGEPGPFMALGVTRPDLWNYYIRSVTHEVGHAWGLYHEHQDPAFWGDGVHIFDFHCENLEDFVEKSAGLSHEEIWGQQGICKDLFAATQRGFSSANFVPLYRYYVSSWNPDHPSDYDVDWKSIMLYGSGDFAIDHGHTARYSITRQRYPPVFSAGQVPSMYDVTAIKSMYIGQWTGPLPPLYNEPQSPYHTLFTSLVQDCSRHR